MTVFPTANEYAGALQHPGRVFGPADLRAAELTLDPMIGIPVGAQGSTAVVFKAKVGGRDMALRFFTRDDASSRDRYRALNKHFTDTGLADCVATSAWEDDAITIGGRTWPMLRMEWVEGRTLDKYVDRLVEDADTTTLGALAGAWRTTVRRLQDAEFAHGDLQHGNVMIDTSGRLRLVDFDGSWIRSFVGQAPPSEQGHPNYQRPSRQWDRWMDTFPALVVYLSLVALSKNPRPWQTLNNEDNLLFTKPDFTAPYRTDVWRHLDQLGNGEVTALAGQLRRACDPNWLATGGLESLLTRQGSAPRLGGGRKWWEEVGPGTTTGAASTRRPSSATTGTPLRPPPKKTTVPPKVITPPRRSGPKWDPKAKPVGPAAGQKHGTWWGAGQPPRAGTGSPQQPPTPVPATPSVDNNLGRDAAISFVALVGVTAAAGSMMGTFAALLIGAAAFVVLFIILRIVHHARG